MSLVRHRKGCAKIDYRTYRVGERESDGRVRRRITLYANPSVCHVRVSCASIQLLEALGGFVVRRWLGSYKNSFLNRRKVDTWHQNAEDATKAVLFFYANSLSRVAHDRGWLNDQYGADWNGIFNLGLKELYTYPSEDGFVRPPAVHAEICDFGSLDVAYRLPPQPVDFEVAS